ncbi:MAG: chemotaxis protein CheB [Gallionella sp.]|nr:chemotaxis protein CheB [Gallionella sp.]MDD4958919.1 chemotaxis protein CheB [Gallionella sp.]
MPAVAVDFPIVGIGASAGGLEAFEDFFKACPSDTGMAFVLVSHLSPDHHSLLTEILQRCTAMPVAQAHDQARVEPNHVYVIPPDSDMSLLNGALQLSHPDKVRGQRLPIDGFFRSLAEDQVEHAIGIILSGTASDGTLGLRAILEAGGVCMVQKPSTAKFDGMPQSAITAGYATHILPVADMPAKLQELAHQSGLRIKVPPSLMGDTLSSLNLILQQIRSSTGHDFSLYKKSTISRRIERRMALHHIDDIAVYARFLKQNPTEVHTLFKELLINVTCFFRDAEAFASLKNDILPALLADKPDNYVFRVWVAGCATGEEAYSIAILFRELMDEAHKDFKVQIYATDLDEEAINTARSGFYPAAIAQNVSPERLSRFFINDAGGYKIKKSIREMVVFAVQSVIKDPPFTRLDLLSCRNLMIYLEAEQQSRLIPNFHYALKPDGVLFLSSSESIAHYTHLFKPLNRKWKLYRACNTASKPSITLIRSSVMTTPEPAVIPIGVTSKPLLGNVAALSNRVLLQSYAPASVTTDSYGNILYVHGDTSRFLRQPEGMVTTNLLDMARDGLQMDLRSALLTASQGTPTLGREVSLKTEMGMLKLSFCLRLLPSGNPESKAEDRFLLVSFQELAEVVKPTRLASGNGLLGADEAERIEHLERELSYSRENLQATLEEQQATNEELKSSNEELQSTNEELQSTNEELETSKEELQSLNEETLTVNSELNSKIDQLSDSQNDLKNLMENINIGIVFLDYHLNIRSYTREAVKAYRLIASDMGRPLGDITCNLQGENMLDEMRMVLETLIPREREVQSNDGVWYLARIQPYRTLDNVIDGVVLTFNDISAARQAEQIKLAASQLARELAEGIVNTVAEPLIVLNSDLQVVSASRAFLQHFKVSSADTLGRKIYDLGNGQWNIPALRELLEDILPQHQTMEGFVMEHNFPMLGMRRMVLNARRIKTMLGDTEFILLVMVNVER